MNGRKNELLVKHPSAELTFITTCTHFCIICPVAIAMATGPRRAMQMAADGKWKLLPPTLQPPRTHKSSLCCDPRRLVTRAGTLGRLAAASLADTPAHIKGSDVFQPLSSALKHLNLLKTRRETYHPALFRLRQSPIPWRADAPGARK